MTEESAADTKQAMQQQAGKLLTQVAGLIGVRTIEMGLRHGLIAAVAKHPGGVAPDVLAGETNLDPFYVEVWCRAAYAAEVLQSGDQGTYQLAPHLDTLLLDQDSPSWIGGLFRIMVQPELFDRFAENLSSGERIWWDQVSPAFIDGVAGTSRPFYTRLLGAGIAQVPGLADRLEQGAHVLELACGVGSGLTRLATAYPNSTFVALDGDTYSLDLATRSFREAGIEDRVSTIHSTFEDLDASDEYDVVLINVSMHECRDIERVTGNVHRALKPGGHFGISDFPFPATTAECRTVPARVLCGIQFFEALIGDQLMPTQAFVDLLNRHSFKNVSAFDVTPVHAISYGQK